MTDSLIDRRTNKTWKLTKRQFHTDRQIERPKKCLKQQDDTFLSMLKNSHIHGKKKENSIYICLKGRYTRFEVEKISSNLLIYRKK